MTICPRVSRQSRLSVSDKGDNDMISGAVNRSPGIYLKAEENPGKLQLGDSRLRRTTSHCPKWGSLPLNEVGWIKQRVRKGGGGGKKESTGK